MLIKATAIVKFSGIYKWDIINPLSMNVMFLIYSFTMQQKPL